MSRDLVLVALALFTWGVGESMFMLFQPLYLQELGASPVSIGAIIGAMATVMAIAHIPSGYLSDRIGRRPLLWLAWVMGLGMALVMALAQSLPIFVLGLLGYSITAGVVAPLNSYITSARGKWSVGRALTLISACFYLGSVIGPWLGGRIGDQIGLRQVYYFAAGVFVFSNLFIFLLRSQPVESRSEPGHPRGLQLSPAYLRFLGIVFLAVFATFLPQPLSANFLQNQRGLSLEQIGQLGSINSLGVVALNLVLGHLDAGLGFLLAQACVGLFSLILWQTSGMPWFALGYFLLGGMRTTRALASAQARELVGKASMGLAFGMIETVGSSAGMVAPVLAGWLYEQNPTWIYPAGLAFIILSLAVSANHVLFKKRSTGKAFDRV